MTVGVFGVGVNVGVNGGLVVVAVGEASTAVPSSEVCCCPVIVTVICALSAVPPLTLTPFE